MLKSKTDNLPPTTCCPVNAPNLKPVRLVGEVIVRIQSYVVLQDSFSGSSEDVWRCRWLNWSWIRRWYNNVNIDIGVLKVQLVVEIDVSDEKVMHVWNIMLIVLILWHCSFFISIVFIFLFKNIMLIVLTVWHCFLLLSLYLFLAPQVL